MPESQEDFWPDLSDTGNIPTPVSLMRAQAALLGQKTNQQVTANVQSLGVSPGAFAWSFQLYSSALGPYRYELFRVNHPIQLYPATFIWENHPLKIVNSETDFKDYLKEIIGSDQTKKLLQSLLAQIAK